MYLVDTNVISAASLRPVPAALVEWMEVHSASLFLSVITVAEIEDGIAKLRRQGGMRKSSDLSEWLEAVLHLYGDRVLGFDIPTARIAGTLADKARGLGQSVGFADIIIAATAGRHDLTILSRNLKHFEPLGISALDPFVTLPSP